jgi:3-oxoacyl-[acyl-carrier protein] reductase
MAESAREFEGAAVVIAGGHVGVGPAVVRAFVDQGANVAVGVLASSGIKEAPSVANIPLDTGSSQSIAAFFDACEKRLGGLAILVMVPPPVKAKNALEFTEEEYRSAIEHELTRPVLCMLDGARRMVARGGGRVISFVSMSGKTGVHKHVAPYAAAKGGVITFSRSLAADLAPTGVTVNVIATSQFDVQHANNPNITEVLQGIPVGRLGRSEEAADAALYLASKRAGYITGETLNMSGGRFMD